MGVVEDKILDMDELAFEPQRGRRVGKMLALDKAVPDRALLHALVEAGQRIFGACERPDQGLKGQVGEMVTH